MMKAIRTEYKGILFRSKLEAQWAKFMDSIQMPWIYEPDGFEFSDGTRYLPDFYLPDSKQWFEVKGVLDDLDEHKIEMLCRESGHDVVIGYANGEFEMCDTCMMDMDERRTLSWYPKCDTHINRCAACKKISFMNDIGSYMCQCCGAYDGDGLIDWIMCGDNRYNHYTEIDASEWRKRATIDIRDKKGQNHAET